MTKKLANVEQSKEIGSTEKINLSNAKKELATKENVSSSRKDIYLNLSELSSDEQKKKRQRIRNQLKRFVSAILGKDRSDEEKEKSIREFLSFYRENWRITDFKIENFSQSKNKADHKDYETLLEFVKSTIE